MIQLAYIEADASKGKLIEARECLLLLFLNPAAVGGAVDALPAPPPRATSVLDWEPEPPFAIFSIFSIFLFLSL
jgi:hypothetical protein